MTTIMSINSIPAVTQGSGIGPGDGQIDAQILFFDVFYVSGDIEFEIFEQPEGN
jgi:hypothetical protein